MNKMRNGEQIWNTGMSNLPEETRLEKFIAGIAFSTLIVLIFTLGFLLQ